MIVNIEGYKSVIDTRTGAVYRINTKEEYVGQKEKPIDAGEYTRYCPPIIDTNKTPE